MITIEKGIMLFLGTCDIYNCHWIEAIKSELASKEQRYDIMTPEMVPNENTVIFIFHHKKPK